ncbi:GNAT family N-acetyltransferase [Methanobacterium alkalithermotolerans]|uniref:GNAT family N-acetyltransferase n=1 Tax=Methanobacterium alkalithermotolerans TaxID=2731220 RepID=A0A8T8K1V0_9EURY|nr:GNAT family N-acetyltransferase [Methanobacterium alkalithermotolerans]QUH22456.1 GNAT family N-acetyltransferase [Methanobacterium alkalithermotolerans]RJS48182.1 MAG: hypothetical protein CIT03_09615 [Methanobacterium sp.]
MSFRMEKYNPQKHDPQKVAEIIYAADVELNSYVLGEKKEAVQTIIKLLEMGNNYFASPYLECALYQDKLVGIVVSSTVKDKLKLDRSSGMAFLKAFGLWTFLKRFPTMIKMDKIVNSNLDDDGFFIHFLSVDLPYQNQGIGTKIIENILKKHEKLYVDVNINNMQGKNFYEKMGFKVQSKNLIKIKNKEIGTYSLRTKE